MGKIRTYEACILARAGVIERTGADDMQTKPGMVLTGQHVGRSLTEGIGIGRFERLRLCNRQAARFYRAIALSRAHYQHAACRGSVTHSFQNIESAREIGAKNT